MRRPTWLRRPHLAWQHGVVIVASLALVAFIGALMLANAHGDDRVALVQNAQSSTNERIDDLTQRLTVLEDENKTLKAEGEKAKAQANTSVGQLVQSGQQPIIAAPDVVTVPTAPITTTTTTPPQTAPPPVEPPVTQPPTTQPPPTEPPSTEPPTTEPPTTTTTTTTEPPTTTTEPPTTTTTEESP